jgi:hypothetical protein
MRRKIGHATKFKGDTIQRKTGCPPRDARVRMPLDFLPPDLPILLLFYPLALSPKRGNREEKARPAIVFVENPR